jgi:hypothetical protein
MNESASPRNTAGPVTSPQAEAREGGHISAATIDTSDADDRKRAMNPVLERGVVV